MFSLGFRAYIYHFVVEDQMLHFHVETGLFHLTLNNKIELLDFTFIRQIQNETFIRINEASNIVGHFVPNRTTLLEWLLSVHNDEII